MCALKWFCDSSVLRVSAAQVLINIRTAVRRELLKETFSDCLVNHIDDKTGRKTYESHDCTVYLGEVRCMDLIGCNLNSENKVTSCSVRSGTVVFGQLVIEDTELTNVDFLMNVSIIGHQSELKFLIFIF